MPLLLAMPCENDVEKKKEHRVFVTNLANSDALVTSDALRKRCGEKGKIILFFYKLANSDALVTSDALSKKDVEKRKEHHVYISN